MLALKTANALLSIEIEGGDSHLALPKQVQRDPLKGFIEHVDLVIVRRGEKVQVEIALHVEGEAAADTLVVTEHPSILIEAEATNIPGGVTVEGLGVGSQSHASDLRLPQGATLVLDPETLVVNVIAAPTAEQLEEELAEAEAEVGIEREEHVEPAEDAAAQPADEQPAARP